MPLCTACGRRLDGDVALCPGHTDRGRWSAAVNRIICDLVHRKTPPPRVADPEPDDDLRKATIESD